MTIQAIDRIESKKILKLTELTESSKAKLSARLPDFISLANPVDLTAAGSEEDFEAVL